MSDDERKPKRRQFARRRGPYETALASSDPAYREPDPDDAELIDELQRIQAQAREGKLDDLDQNNDRVIRLSLQAKAKWLLRKAIRDPNSDAGKMVYIWILNALAITQKELSPEVIKMLNEERSRHELVKIIDKQRGRIFDQDLDLRQTRTRLHQADTHLGQARDLATVTRKQLESGEEVDMRAICGRIADIVGLRPPPQLGGVQSSAPDGMPTARNE